jgi:hypothetical protein
MSEDQRRPPVEPWIEGTPTPAPLPVPPSGDPFENYRRNYNRPKPPLPSDPAWKDRLPGGRIRS